MPNSTQDIIYFNKIFPYSSTMAGDSVLYAIPFTMSPDTRQSVYKAGKHLEPHRDRIRKVLESRGFTLIQIEWVDRKIIARKDYP